MLADLQNVLAKHEMFEEIGGGETIKQGQEVKCLMSGKQCWSVSPGLKTLLITQICCEMFLIKIKNIFVDWNGEKCFRKHVVLVAKTQTFVM